MHTKTAEETADSKTVDTTLSDAQEENTVLACILKMRERMGEMYTKVITGHADGGCFQHCKRP